MKYSNLTRKIDSKMEVIEIDSVDVSKFNVYHTISKNLVKSDEFDVWINSQITKDLIKILNYYCIDPTIVRMEDGDEEGDIHIVVRGQFDIKKGILERKRDQSNNHMGM